jgi:hypothetical protein
MTFFILGLIGFGGYAYFQYLESQYKSKIKALKKEVRSTKLKISVNNANKNKIETQLTTEYQTLSKSLREKYLAKERALKNKYGTVETFKKKVESENKNVKKDIHQREVGLKKLKKKLATKNNKLTKLDIYLKKLKTSINNIQLECRIYDLRAIDKAVKEFQEISYATEDRVNLLCGFDPSNRTLVNKNYCLKGKRDRAKARSLLSLIESLAVNVKQGQSYIGYVHKQRYRMKIVK